MKEHCPGLLLQISNPLLHNAILEVSIDSTVQDLLPTLFSRLDEGIVRKSPIVSMVVSDCDFVSLAETLKRQLSLQSICR